MSYPKRVVCVDDNYGAAPTIVKGKEYTALSEVPCLLGGKPNGYMLDLPGLASGPWDMSRFQDVVAATPISPSGVLATWDTIKKGQRVQCVYRGARLADTGKVFHVDRTGNLFIIHWDDGTIHLSAWTRPESFMILSDIVAPGVPVATPPSIVAVNDHVCPSCQNDRCSKNEKTCWRCGGVL